MAGVEGEKQAAPFGSWESPLSASFITEESVRLSSLEMSEDHLSKLFWVEGRPQEGGRQCVVMYDCSTGEVRDVTPRDMNARSRVHEYGGGQSVAVDNEGGTITSDFSSNHLKYTETVDAPIVSLTSSSTYRYADMVLDPVRCRLGGDRVVFAVREDHSIDEPSKVVNTIVALSMNDAKSSNHREEILVNRDQDPNVLLSSPRVDSTGSYLCWVQWKHPNMPWDSSELCIATLSPDGYSLSQTTVVAGSSGGPGSAKESVMQPRWCSNALLYISDKNDGWWNLFKVELGSHQEQEHAPTLTYKSSAVLLSKGYEFGPPAWVFGIRTYAVLEASRQLVCTWHRSVGGEKALQVVVCSIDEENELVNGEGDLSTASMRVLPLPSSSPQRTSLSTVTSLVLSSPRGQSASLFLIGGSPSSPSSVHQVDVNLGSFALSPPRLIKASLTHLPDQEYISRPLPVEFPTRLLDASGNELGQATAHGLFYSPCNKRFRGEEGALPPLLVKIHGGPTGQASSVYRLDIQFFTSRGIAVLDVNYGGSTGYGREYRNRLDGTWGLTDVEDCCRGAAYLVSKGWVDGDKLCIDGGSAGGFTALCSVAFRDTFKAATSSYGVGDLEALATDTHKFESRYLDKLVGKYPESKEIFESRSAMRHAEKISCPILILQGEDDKVVPPNQARMMHEAVVKNNIPAALVMFQGEGHGWRKASTIQRALKLELSFYGLIFGFTPDSMEEVPIENF